MLPIYSLKRTLFVLILVMVCLFTSSTRVSATIFSCEVSVSPTTTTRDTSTVYTFSTESASYSGGGAMWIRFTRPSGDFVITNGSASGWSATISDSEVTLTSATQVAPPSFIVYATSGSNDAASADWNVQMADNGSGNSPKTCTGSLGTSISGSSSITPTPTPTSTPVPDTTAPTISDVTISGVSESSVTISWQTSESANALINYGTSTSYGSSKTNDSFSTSHSLTLDNLSGNTTYHGQIRSIDSSGNAANSNDFTFATSQATTTVTVTTTVTTTTVVTPTPTPTPTPDRQRPKVNLTTDIDSVFDQAPLIEGTATDNVGVTTVEYTIDDGVHWVTVDEFNTPGDKSITFAFTPFTKGDGNYLVKVRALDAENNQIETTVQTMIIDRLPPLMGGALFSIGPQVLDPSPNGTFFTLAGMFPKVTFDAVGGPTSIHLKQGNRVFSLQQNPHTLLWSGNLPFEEPGTYTIELQASDGAKNQTTQLLPALTVLPYGTVSDNIGPVSNAQLSIYYFDIPSQTFRLWGGQQYGQLNPVFTNQIGQYALFLPPGTYFLQITSPHTRPLKTNIFTLNQSTPINQNFFIQKKKGFFIGNFNLTFPDFGQNDAMMEIDSALNVETYNTHLVGQAFPDFDLDRLSNVSLKGKPAIISVMTTWLPQTAEQIHILDELQDLEHTQKIVIMSQETSASVYVFAQRGGYRTPIISDPDGVLIPQLYLNSLPTHYFLDSRGVVQKVVTGILDKQQIELGLKESAINYLSE